MNESEQAMAMGRAAGPLRRAASRATPQLKPQQELEPGPEPPQEPQPEREPGASRVGRVAGREGAAASTETLLKFVRGYGHWTGAWQDHIHVSATAILNGIWSDPHQTKSHHHPCAGKGRWWGGEPGTGGASVGYSAGKKKNKRYG